jgi:F0F1-type ATP synthase assembly protein I
VKEPQPQKAAWSRYTDAAAVGTEIAVAITVGSLGGMWLEHNVTHWAPWTTVIGFLIGVLAAGKAVMRTVKTYKASLREDDADKKGAE